MVTCKTADATKQSRDAETGADLLQLLHPDGNMTPVTERPTVIRRTGSVQSETDERLTM